MAGLALLPHFLVLKCKLDSSLTLQCTQATTRGMPDLGGAGDTEDVGGGRLLR